MNAAPVGGLSRPGPLQVDLPKVLGRRIGEMPWIHRILAENLAKAP